MSFLVPLAEVTELYPLLSELTPTRLAQRGRYLVQTLLGTFDCTKVGLDKNSSDLNCQRSMPLAFEQDVMMGSRGTALFSTHFMR